ncbi:MAG: DNA-binding protein [Thermoproteus sp. AZ2]|jgi:hypothetical protein|uniref:DNA-binding protein n=1 Tax=Thermoproteus sp. AZ2 TaxID=1609232 RepID=A0ACC6V0R0_9CREN
MSEDIDSLLRRKALEIAAKQAEKSLKKAAERPLTKEEVLAQIRSMLKGDRAQEILDTALKLYGDSLMPLLRKLVDLKRQGVLSELWDHELYRLLTNAGFHVPVETRLRIVRHGREYKLGEGD